jgi:hypothetical protein
MAEGPGGRAAVPVPSRMVAGSFTPGARIDNDLAPAARASAAVRSQVAAAPRSTLNPAQPATDAGGRLPPVPACGGDSPRGYFGQEEEAAWAPGRGSAAPGGLSPSS